MQCLLTFAFAHVTPSDRCGTVFSAARAAHPAISPKNKKSSNFINRSPSFLHYLIRIRIGSYCICSVTSRETLMK